MAEATNEDQKLAQDYSKNLSNYQDKQANNAKFKKQIEAEMDKVVDWMESNIKLRSTVLAEELVVNGRKDVKTFTVKYFTGKIAN